MTKDDNAQKSESSENAYTIVLPQALDIIAAEELLQDFKKAFEKSKHIELDGSKVERLTTPCVQLLVALDKSLEREDNNVRITDPSEAMQNSFAILGLEETLTAWSIEQE